MSRPETITADEWRRRYGTGTRSAQPKRSEMNKTETSYAQHLDLLKRAGEIVAWERAPFSLRLAPRTHYVPDFLVRYLDGALECHETKAGNRRDGRYWTREKGKIKAKVAAERYRAFFGFAIVWPFDAQMQTWGRETL